MIERATLAAWIGLFLSAGGCGYGQFQTARTTPPGQVRFTVAQLYVQNKNVEERRVWFYNFPQQVDFRVGLSEQVDLGAKLFLFGGLLADVKGNLIRNTSDFALAIHGGAGAAVVDKAFIEFRTEDPVTIVHAPIGVIASYRFLGQLSPYLGLDYGFYWIFGYDLDYRDPNQVYAKRAGYGDGVARITLGLEWELSRRLALLAEYDLLAPLVDDPGDNFAFVVNHIFGIGVRF
jgi:hypothetical protein